MDQNREMGFYAKVAKEWEAAEEPTLAVMMADQIVNWNVEGARSVFEYAADRKTTLEDVESVELLSKEEIILKAHEVRTDWINRF